MWTDQYWMGRGFKKIVQLGLSWTLKKKVYPPNSCCNSLPMVAATQPQIFRALQSSSKPHGHLKRGIQNLINLNTHLMISESYLYGPLYTSSFTLHISSFGQRLVTRSLTKLNTKAKPLFLNLSCVYKQTMNVKWK